MKFTETSQTLSHILLYSFIKTLSEQGSIISRQRVFARNLQTLYVILFIARERQQDFTILKDNEQKSYFTSPNGFPTERCMLLIILLELELQVYKEKYEPNIYLK